MFDKLREIEQRFTELTERLNDPAAYGDHRELTKLQREVRELSPVVDVYRAYCGALSDETAARG